MKQVKNWFARPTIRSMALCGVMIALEVVLQRFCGISNAVIQLHFGFLPIAVIAFFYGPLYAGFGWAAADILGMLIFPTGGGGWYFGFTVSAFLMGVLFGVFLCRVKEKPLPRILAATLSVSLLITFCLDMFWLHLYWGNGFLALLPTRLIKIAVMIPLQALCLLGLQRLIMRAHLYDKF